MQTFREIGKSFENLANAVVAQAAEDYMNALKRLKRDPGNTVAMYDAAAQMRFFRSDWFAMLTSADPDYIIEVLNKKVNV